MVRESEWKSLGDLVRGLLLALVLRASSLYTGVPNAAVRNMLSLMLGVAVGMLLVFVYARRRHDATGREKLVLFSVSLVSIAFLNQLDVRSGQRLDLRVTAEKESDQIRVTVRNTGRPLSNRQDLYLSIYYEDGHNDIITLPVTKVPGLTSIDIESEKYVFTRTLSALPLDPEREAQIWFSVDADDCGLDNNESERVVVTAMPVVLGISEQPVSQNSHRLEIHKPITIEYSVLAPAQYWITPAYPPDLTFSEECLFVEEFTEKGIQRQAADVREETRAIIALHDPDPTQTHDRRFRVIYVQGEVPLTYEVTLGEPD